MTDVNALSKPGIIAGSSWMGSEAAMKDGTQLPHITVRADTVESQLVLRTKGLTNKDTTSPWGTKRHMDTLCPTNSTGLTANESHAYSLPSTSWLVPTFQWLQEYNWTWRSCPARCYRVYTPSCFKRSIIATRPRSNSSMWPRRSSHDRPKMSPLHRGPR